MQTYTNSTGKTFDVKKAGERFFYWSPRALRWMPVAKSKVSFS